MSIKTSRIARLPAHCIAIAVIAAILAGCGSAPKREPAAGTTKSGTPGGGGYYLDDGPGDRTPADLDAIPDAVPRVEPLHRGTSRPYTVMGRNYTPMTALAPYRARGTATWYGRRYHGKQTSSGEIYDMYGMTAAHTTLPIPSYVRVTNVANGKSVVVRVNDRGPFIDNRLIDLSYTAAHKLGVIASGSALVEVESIIPGSGPPPAVATAPVSTPPAPRMNTAVPLSAPEPVIAAPLPPVASSTPVASAAPAEPAASSAAGIYLQFGAFGSKENAEGFLARMKSQIDWLADRLQLVQRDGLYRVHAGPYGNTADARQAADRVAQTLGLYPVLQTR